mmetsp:Transcript_34370/g.97637  ORF Transcript_34370/g.97637 Transcript_34370/m.97637 type:complete len:234 (+) Transcript_34370:1343-2044(+)
MDPPQIVDSHIVAFSFTDQIHHLAASQTLGSNGFSQSADHVEDPRGFHLVLWRVLGDPLKAGTQQGIACQNGNVFTIDNMICGFSTSQVVVIHAGQVVMNQTHGVDHFQGHRRRHGNRLVSAKHFAGRQAKDGADSLSTCHERISHRFRNQICLRLRADHRVLESLGNGRLLGHDVLSKIEFGGGLAGYRKSRGRSLWNEPGHECLCCGGGTGDCCQSDEGDAHDDIYSWCLT